MTSVANQQKSTSGATRIGTAAENVYVLGVGVDLSVTTKQIAEALKGFGSPTVRTKLKSGNRVTSPTLSIKHRNPHP